MKHFFCPGCAEEKLSSPMSKAQLEMTFQCHLECRGYRCTQLLSYPFVVISSRTAHVIQNGQWVMTTAKHVTRRCLDLDQGGSVFA